MAPNPLFSRRELLASGAALGLAACGGPARGRDPLASIEQGLAATPLPAPWRPIVVSGTAVEVAGHRFRFDAGPMPTSLEVNAAELLFDAVKLDIRVQDELLVWQRARTISVDAAHVELLARGNAGDLIAQSRVTIGYDGMCHFRVSLIPQGIVTIDSVLLDVPILRSETLHYAHHLLGGDLFTHTMFGFSTPPQDYWGGGAVPENGWSGAMTPHFWVGNADRGIVWFTELIQSSERQAAAAQLQLRPVEGAMRLLVELISDPLDMPDTVHLDFGLQPTPVRPPSARSPVVRPTPVSWSNTGLSAPPAQARAGAGTPETLAALRDQGATALVLDQNWSDIPGFPYIASADRARAFQDLIDQAHGAGLKVLPTISALTLSTRAPGAVAAIDQMPLPIDSVVENDSPPERVHPLFHNDATVSFFTEAVRSFATEFPIDGVFVQLGDPAVRLLPQTERVTGAEAALDIRGRRDLLRSLYALFHGGLRERDEDGIVIAQTNIPWSMIHGHADLVVTGLNLYRGIAAGRRSGGGLAERWQPDAFPFLFGDILHRVPTHFHVPPPDSRFAGVLANYRRAELLSDEELIGLAVVHAMPLWAEDGAPADAQESFARLETLRRDLGFGNATWHPYWQRERNLSVQPPGTMYGYWQSAAGELLVLALNGADLTQDVLIELDGAGPSESAGLAVEDVWGGAPVRTRDNLVFTTLERAQLAALHVRGGER